VAAGDSIVSICNSAMSWLGEDPIVSLTDATKRAILLSNRYDPVRRRVLREHPWKCAKQQVTLALSTYVPLVTYDFAYALPADCLRFWDLPDNDQAEWEVGQDAAAGRLLFTNEEAPLCGVYIYDLTDPTRMDAELVDVLALELALDLVGPLTEDKGKEDRIVAKLKDKKAAAKLVNADEASSKEWDEDIWLRARR
jgi:hypothetical protein